MTPAKNDDGFVVHSFARRRSPSLHRARQGAARPGETRRPRRARRARRAIPARGTIPRPGTPSRREDEAARASIEAPRAWRFGTRPSRRSGRSLNSTSGEASPRLDPGRRGVVIRYHPECPWGDELTRRTFRVPCMVAAMRSIETDEIVAIQRTRLSTRRDKRSIVACWGRGRRGDQARRRRRGDARADVGEGLETAMTARQLGLRPVWALGSAGAISALSRPARCRMPHHPRRT